MKKWLAATFLVVAAGALAGDEMPWAFNTERGQGYAIDLVSVDPAPGTPLLRGSSVTIKVTAKYSMSVAKEGQVFLVLQDEKNRKVEATRDPGSIPGNRCGRHGGTECHDGRSAQVEGSAHFRAAVPQGPRGNHGRNRDPLSRGQEALISAAG